jgi:hypothetical protein
MDMITSGAGEETVVENILVPYNAAVEFYFYNGTNTILFDAATSNGAKLGGVFANTYTVYYRVKNVSGGAIYMGYTGHITKVAT